MSTDDKYQTSIEDFPDPFDIKIKHNYILKHNAELKRVNKAINRKGAIGKGEYP